MNWEKILKIFDVERKITAEYREQQLNERRDLIGMVCLHAHDMATPRTRAAIYQMHLLILFLFFGSKKFCLRVNGLKFGGWQIPLHLTGVPTTDYVELRK